MVALCKRYKSALMVDDAHGLGVLGKNGSGTANHFGVVDDVDIIMGTFSKSLASIGGFIAADADVIDYLKHTARAMIFSASMPPPSVGAVLRALDIIEEEPERIDRLWANARFMREALQAEGFDTGTSCTPIIPVMIGEYQAAYVMCAKLFEAGVFVNPVPGLSMESRRSLLRVSVMATHEREQLERALEAIVRIGRELGVLQRA
jgi:7-keto-8-aminopelargonate synthetase-like enzyme